VQGCLSFLARRSSQRAQARARLLLLSNVQLSLPLSCWEQLLVGLYCMTVQLSLLRDPITPPGTAGYVTRYPVLSSHRESLCQISDPAPYLPTLQLLGSVPNEWWPFGGPWWWPFSSFTEILGSKHASSKATPKGRKAPEDLVSAPGILSINITIFGPSNKANHELICKLGKCGLPKIPGLVRVLLVPFGTCDVDLGEGREVRDP
jgi:hypothetical protein